MLIEDSTSQSDSWMSSFMSNTESLGGPGEKSDISTFESSPIAALLSLCDAATIILLRLLFLVSDSAVRNTERIRRHAQSILSANSFINAGSGSAPDRGTTIMVLQLKTVSLWSPFLDQRETALGLLQGEKVQKGGFAEISAATPEYFSDVAAFVLQKYPLE
ncbi:hypothetical protein PT974_05247 [Cladobotryum mycophilum]|uniref:Uncharacterized protein n=1 Tax=Cladobotryum mycophilum TaxID=491253 RepID=A0ABR0SJ39_9HYPO